MMINRTIRENLCMQIRILLIQTTKRIMVEAEDRVDAFTTEEEGVEDTIISMIGDNAETRRE